MNKWAPLMTTNLLGVLNDNFLKYLVIFISVDWLTEQHGATVIMLASGLFVLPYIILSPFAGWLAKTHYKQRIVVQAKFWEMAIMLVAAAGFLLTSVELVLSAVMLMGAQSCLFSPAKYGLIRDVDGEKGISFGIGAMEMLTFLGVLIGPALAGYVSDHAGAAVIFFLLSFFAVAGWIASRQIRIHETVPESRNVSREEVVSLLIPGVTLVQSYRKARGIQGLNLTVLGIGMFWLIGSLIQLTMTTHCPGVLGMSNFETGLVMTVVALSIALGCFLAGVISKERVLLSLVPVGGAGLSVCTTLIYLLQPGPVYFIVLITGAAFFAGLFKIPLNSNIQAIVKGRLLGEMIAYNNLVLFLFILISSAVFGWAGTYFNQESYTYKLFLIIACCSWAITIILYRRIRQPHCVNQP